MKQKLLTDIELDVHELKYLMESFSKEPTQTLSELLKRSIARMQGRLDELSQEVDAVEVGSVVVEEDEEGDSLIAEEKPVITEEVPVVEEEPVIDKKEEPKSVV